jgi:hypothetical protein
VGSAVVLNSDRYPNDFGNKVVFFGDGGVREVFFDVFFQFFFRTPEFFPVGRAAHFAAGEAGLFVEGADDFLNVER